MTANLQRVRDKVEGGLRLRRIGSHQGASLWRVEASRPPGRESGESGESDPNPSREQYRPASTEAPGVQ